MFSLTWELSTTRLTVGTATIPRVTNSFSQSHEGLILNNQNEEKLQRLFTSQESCNQSWNALNSHNPAFLIKTFGDADVMHLMGCG